MPTNADQPLDTSFNKIIKLPPPSGQPAPALAAARSVPTASPTMAALEKHDESMSISPLPSLSDPQQHMFWKTLVPILLKRQYPPPGSLTWWQEHIMWTITAQSPPPPPPVPPPSSVPSFLSVPPAPPAPSSDHQRLPSIGSVPLVSSPCRHHCHWTGRPGGKCDRQGPSCKTKHRVTYSSTCDRCGWTLCRPCQHTITTHNLNLRGSDGHRM